MSRSEDVGVQNIRKQERMCFAVAVFFHSVLSFAFHGEAGKKLKRYYFCSATRVRNVCEWIWVGREPDGLMASKYKQKL